MKIIASVFVLFSLPLSAATITFEEFSIGDTTVVTGPVGQPIGTLETQGYLFTGLGFSGAVAPNEGEPGRVVAGNSGSNAWGASFFFPGLDSFGPIAQLSMSRVDGLPFAIQSIDIFYDAGPGQSFTQTTGTVFGGATADLSTPIGTGDWLNLEVIRFEAIGDGFGFGGVVTAEIDNIAVDVVPIPAAAWLFGSALAGLGWLRRR
jgi:hypothetical protein